MTGGTPGYIYWWRGPGLYTSSSQNITGLFAGPYDVVITDTNGCQISIDTIVSQPSKILVTFTSTNPVCKGVASGSVDITVNGGELPYTYNWSNGSTTEDITNIAAGTYTFVLTDGFGCIDSTIVSISEPNQILIINKDVTTLKCYGDSIGRISVTTTGGTTPYTYQWSTGSTSNNISQLSTGIYIVTVTDSIGCVKSDTTILSQPDSLYLTLYSPLQFDGFNVTNANGNDGYINLTVNGGTSPFTYLWSNNATTEDLNNLTAGNYNVVVVDTNGCKASASIVLTEPYVLQMPQGYSPNNDTKNDLFVIRGIEAYPDNVLTIYNRWGNIVYSKKGYLNEWDGHSNNGQELPNATYFAILEVNKGEIVLKGFVELRR